MEIILALLMFLLCVLAMSVGVLFKREPLKGSCGGIAAMMGGGKCSLCGGDPNRCEEIKQAPEGDSDLAYDAAKTGKQ